MKQLMDWTGNEPLVKVVGHLLIQHLKREMISGRQLPGKKRSRFLGLAREFRLGPLIDRWCVFVREVMSGKESENARGERKKGWGVNSTTRNTGFSNYKLIDRAYISLTMAASTPYPLPPPPPPGNPAPTILAHARSLFAAPSPLGRVHPLKLTFNFERPKRPRLFSKKKTRGRGVETGGFLKGLVGKVYFKGLSIAYIRVFSTKRFPLK